MQKDTQTIAEEDEPFFARTRTRTREITEQSPPPTGSDSGVCHYFCCDSEESLLNWQQALASHIGLGGVASAGGASGPQRTPNISINTSPGGPGTGPNRNSALNTPKSRSMKSGGIVGNAVSATVNALSNKKQSVVGTLSSRMSVGTGNEAAAGKKNYYTMPEAELNKAFESMVDELRLPPKAASMMLKMPKPQKIQMLEAHQVKKKSVQFFFFWVHFVFVF